MTLSGKEVLAQIFLSMFDGIESSSTTDVCKSVSVCVCVHVSLFICFGFDVAHVELNRKHSDSLLF